jgi:glycerophosphoryl diester phosphodiesterase
MICIGHRGARGYAPENTLASIDLAIGHGAKWIEIDVREHHGDLVVIHDRFLERTTNGFGDINQHDLPTLQTFNAGDGQHIPTLEQVIKHINRRAILNIELKDMASAKPTLQLIERLVDSGWQFNDFLISSFFHHALQWFKQSQPSLRIGALCASVMIDYAKFAQDLNAWSINLCSESLNQAIVDDAHQRGLKVFVYTVNDVRLFDELSNMGVDGVFTDYPQRFMQWKNNMSSTT